MLTSYKSSFKSYYKFKVFNDMILNNQLVGLIIGSLKSHGDIVMISISSLNYEKSVGTNDLKERNKIDI